jgi:hypothetical protein
MGFADIAVVDFAPHVMTHKPDHLRGLRRASFHFIVAENPDPEPMDSSAWLAVDQPHEGLLRLTQCPLRPAMLTVTSSTV